MLRAHRQAWAWQDEWHGLTMEDIRQIERQTQEALKLTMSGNYFVYSILHFNNCFICMRVNQI